MATPSAIARALTIGETYFFREPLHFELLRESLLPAALARSSRPLTIVSAACSSGEEAYSLAITARRVLGEAATGRVRVLGFDVNERSVTAARRGVYRAWSLRGMDDAVKRRWFEHATNEWSVSPEARSLTTFERRNLVDAADALPAGSADIIFCRNVLIYFDDASVALVLTRLAAALRPHGSLIVGSAEAALFAFAGLGSREVGDVWVHTRGEEQSREPASSAPPHLPSTSSSSASSSKHRATPPPQARRRAERHRGPTATTDEMPATPATGSLAAGDVADHLDRGWALLDASPALAAEQARRAILLDRTLAAAHILAASAALAEADVRGARRALRHARRYLSATPAGEIVRGSGGATGAEMESYCARLVRAVQGRDR